MENKTVCMKTESRYIIFLLFLWSSMVCMAVPIKTICGEYTYIVPDNVSREDAKRTAAERARMNALATGMARLYHKIIPLSSVIAMARAMSSFNR